MSFVACPAQDQTWWNQKCEPCGHNLAMHTTNAVEELECALCEIRASLEAQVDQKLALRDTEITSIRETFNNAAPVIPSPLIPEPDRNQP